MKQEYQTLSETTIQKRNELFELVVTRDNVGEAMWFIYTGILISCIVQLKITSTGCVTTPKQMEQNYQAYLNQEEKTLAAQKLATSQVYTITN